MKRSNVMIGQQQEDLGDTLTEPQQALNKFKQAAEDFAFNAFGQMIMPVIAPALEVLTAVDE